jgi:hypothetical protein
MPTRSPSSTLLNLLVSTAELGRIWLAEFGRIWQNIAGRIWQNIMAGRIRQNTAKYGKATSIKEELPVSTAAINPITVATDMPCDPTSLVPICI